MYIEAPLILVFFQFQNTIWINFKSYGTDHDLAQKIIVFFLSLSGNIE